MNVIRLVVIASALTTTASCLRPLMFACLLLAAALPAAAQVPQLISYQGRVAVGSANFNGSGSGKSHTAT